MDAAACTSGSFAIGLFCRACFSCSALAVIAFITSETHLQIGQNTHITQYVTKFVIYSMIF